MNGLKEASWAVSPADNTFLDLTGISGISAAGRELQAVDSCDRQCGVSTCAFFNESFSCERLELLSCSCEGCCFHAPLPLGAGSVILIFIISLWALCLLCFANYRYWARKDVLKLFDGPAPTWRQSYELNDLSSEQEKALRRRRRYGLHLISFFLPFVAMCCPALHRFYLDSVNGIFADIANCWYRCLGRATRVKKRAKEATRRAGELAKTKTVQVIQKVESGVTKTAAYVGEGLVEHNLHHGLTLGSATQRDHGKHATSGEAAGILKTKGSSKKLVKGGAGEDGEGGGDLEEGLPSPPPAAQKRSFNPASVGTMAYALVAVAHGGTADVRGEAEEILLAAERLERAAEQARIKVARARGERYVPLRPMGVSSEEYLPARLVELQNEVKEGVERLRVEERERSRLESELESAKEAAKAAEAKAEAAAAEAAATAAAAAASSSDSAGAGSSSTTGGGGARAQAKALRSEVATLAKEVADEVESEQTEAVTEVLRPNFRASFAGRKSFAAGGAEEGSMPKKRQSFLQLYERNSTMAPKGRDSWADGGEEEDDENSSKRASGAGSKARASIKAAFGIGLGNRKSTKAGADDGGGALANDEEYLKKRQEREERLKKLDEATKRAEEVQRRAEEELAALGQQGDKPNDPIGNTVRRLSTGVANLLGGGSQRPSLESLDTTVSADPSEPPKWEALLKEYKEQRDQIEEWLQMEPTEEEVEDGSAMEKAITLLTARDDLTAKIQQLEAVGAAHAAAAASARRRDLNAPRQSIEIGPGGARLERGMSMSGSI